jgi:Ras-related C3 botulinum toxin substrate 1
MHNVKCVCVGDSGVGKTCLLIAYTSNAFPDDYIPTTFETYCANLIVSRKPVRLDIFDTHGHEEYDRLRPLSYPDTHVFIVCFSVVTPVSFDHVRTKWIGEVRTHSPAAKILLVGTKCDLRSDAATVQRMKEDKVECVTMERGQELAKEMKLDGYVEVSARTQLGLKDVFEKAVSAVVCGVDTPPPAPDAEESSCSIA